jgi:hypothetical protein
MAPLNKDLPVALAKGEYLEPLIYNGATLYIGAMVCLDAQGFAHPAADTAGFIMAGTNVGGTPVKTQVGDGATIYCRIDRKRIAKRINSSGDAVTVADIGKVIYVEDDCTVNHTGGSNHIAAGICVSIDTDGGVWVDHYLAPVAL